MNLITHRSLVFVHGKGGVGKTAVSQALSLSLARRGEKTLWVVFEDPQREPGELSKKSPTLWHLNADSTLAFEEYAGLKISGLGFGLGHLGAIGLSKFFTQNRLIRYLAKAAPGIHELVLLGKVWHERNTYQHVVVDMPSTGYGIAMFQSTINFAKLFGGGPLSRDAEAMLVTFADPRATGHLIVSLPEEMPLLESLELKKHLAIFFPRNSPEFLLNRRFPPIASGAAASRDPDAGPPFATTALEYAARRSALEAQNLRLWEDQGLEYGQIRYLPPDGGWDSFIERLASELEAGRYI